MTRKESSIEGNINIINNQTWRIQIFEAIKLLLGYDSIEERILIWNAKEMHLELVIELKVKEIIGGKIGSWKAEWWWIFCMEKCEY